MVSVPPLHADLKTSVPDATESTGGRLAELGKECQRKKREGEGGGEEETFKQCPKTSIDNVYDNYANSSYQANIGACKGRRHDRHRDMVKVIICANGEVFARGNIAVLWLWPGLGLDSAGTRVRVVVRIRAR